MSSITVVILDDDAFLLKVLQRTIHRAYPEVDIMTTSDIDEFWQLLNTKQDLDLVLSDYLMPQMNGLDVLEQCSSQNPYPVRALLTGDMTLSTMMRQPNVVHAYLAKPFNEADITALFDNVAALKSLPFAFNVRRQLGAMISFPVYPLILKELRDLVQSDEFDLHDISYVVSQEPIITAKLLQLANSAYLGFIRPTSSIDEAVSMESFFEFNFEISESLDDMVAEFELKNHMHHWNEWGMEDSNDGASDLVLNEGDSNGESHPNPVRSKFPK